MKKTLIAVAAAAALTTSAFAEVTFGGWGRAIWAPIASMGGDAITFTSTSWGGDGRVGYGMDFTSENVDVHADFKLEDGSADINDQLKIVMRPVEGVQVSIGKLQDDTLRGDACFGSWNWIRPTWIGDEGLTFSRTVDINKGVELKVTAIDNLALLVGIPVTAGTKTEDAYKAIKIGAGYTIDGIGQIKAQFLGNGAEDDLGNKYTGDFEAAFKLTAVENLALEVGFKTKIMDEDVDIYWGKDDAGNKLVNDYDKATKNLKGHTIALGARYQVNDACAVAANAQIFLATASDVDPSFQFGAGVDYALDNGIGLAADVRVEMPQNDVDPSVGFMVGATKGFSNGSLGVGFQGVNVAEKSGTGLAGHLMPVDGLVWALPVVFTYWF